MALLELPHFRDTANDRFGRHLAGLSRDAAHFTEAVRHQAAGTGHDAARFAHELADGAIQQGAVAAKVLGKQALQMGKAVRRNPLPTVVAVIGIACLASLIATSWSQRH